MHAHRKLQYAAVVGTGHAELETAEHGFFAGFWQVAEFGSDHAADGVELVVGELAAEAVVEVGDRRERADQEAAIGLGLDQLLARRIIFIVFVVDFADDFLEHILDRDQAGQTAIFVDHDGHVIARQAELLEQDVQALGFGNHRHRPQQAAEIARRRAFDEALEQILGQKNADDLVRVVAMHGETRVTRFDHVANDLGQGRVGRQQNHLPTRQHDVGNGQVGHLDGAFDH